MGNSNQFYVKFGKYSHSIDVVYYSQYLSSLDTVLKEINYSVNGINDVAIEVLAENPGSIKILLRIVEKGVGLAKSSAGIVGKVVGIFSDVNEIKKKIDQIDTSKTDIDESTGKIYLRDSNNNIIHQTNTVNYNIFQNPVVSDGLSQQYIAIGKDPEIESYSIIDEQGRSLYNAEKEDFSALARKIDHKMDTNTLESEVPAELVVSKIVLDNKNRKWGFIYGTRPISAIIQDEDFWKKVFAHEISFANGDTLIANLKIVREFNQALQVYVETGEYIVTQVRDVKRMVQQGLNL